MNATKHWHRCSHRSTWLSQSLGFQGFISFANYLNTYLYSTSLGSSYSMGLLAKLLLPPPKHTHRYGKSTNLGTCSGWNWGVEVGQKQLNQSNLSRGWWNPTFMCTEYNIWFNILDCTIGRLMMLCLAVSTDLKRLHSNSVIIASMFNGRNHRT